MKKDIAVIREAITKVVSLLTRQSIKVTQRGVKAYVQYSTKDGSIELVNIPYIPDDATEEFIAAVQGFLDHEVGHVLFTNSAVVIKSKKKGPRIKNLANVLEDVYIERKMTEAFQGSVNNLESVRKFYLEKMALPKIKEALAAGDKETAAGYIAVIQFRAWGGQVSSQDLLRANPGFAELIAPMVKAIGPKLIERVSRLKSSEDCLKLAIEIDAATKPPPPPPAPPAPPAPSPEASPEKGKGGGEPDSDAGSGDSEADKGEDKSEPEDKGTTSTEADDSGKKRDESSTTEEEGKSGGSEGEGDSPADADPAPAPDGEGAGDGEEGDGVEEDAPPSGSGGGSEDDSTESDAAPSTDSDGGSDASDGGEPSDAGEASGGGDAGEGDEPEDYSGTGDGAEEAPAGTETAGEPSDDDADPEASGEEGTGAADESGGKSDTSGRTVDDTAGDTEDASTEEDTGTPFEAAHDFDTDASKVLSDAAGKAMRSSDYKVFSTDWDKVYEAPMADRSDSVEKMVDKVQHMVAGIQKQLERAMAAQDKKTWNPGQRRGRISPGALFRTATGDDRVFRTRHETRAKNTAVSLLVDCSGSMFSGDRIGTAGLAAFALSSTLERLKIHHEVLGYTTARSGAMSAAMAAEGAGISYARHQALRIPVFKSFHERLNTDAKSRIAHLTESPRWLSENVDGESLQIAAHRLLSQRAERHVLIVLSDGEPACPGDYGALNDHLKAVVEKLEKKNVEVVGIGIQTRSVRHFYTKSLVLNNLSELPTTLVGQLTKILLAP